MRARVPGDRGGNLELVSWYGQKTIGGYAVVRLGSAAHNMQCATRRIAGA
jgi:hypothetical protein